MSFFHNAGKKQLLVSLTAAQGSALTGKLDSEKHKAKLVKVGTEYVLEISFVGRSGVGKGEAGYFYDGTNPPIIHPKLADILGGEAVTGRRTPGTNFQPRLLTNPTKNPTLNQYLAYAKAAAPAPTAATVTGGMVSISYNSPGDANSVGANTTLCAKPLVFKIPGYTATLEAPSLEVFYQAAKVSLGARLPAENTPEYYRADGARIDQNGLPHQGETNTMRAIFDTAWKNLGGQHAIQQTYGTSNLVGRLSSFQDTNTGNYSPLQATDYTTTFNNNSAAIMFQLELMKFSQDLDSYNELMALCGGDPTKLDLVENAGARDTFWGCDPASNTGCNYQGQIVQRALIYLQQHQIARSDGTVTGFFDPNGTPLVGGYTHFYDGIPAGGITLTPRFTNPGTKRDGRANDSKITIASLGQITHRLNGSFYNSAALNPSIQSYAATNLHTHLSYAQSNGKLQTGGVRATAAAITAARAPVAPLAAVMNTAIYDECDKPVAVVTLGLSLKPAQAIEDRKTIKESDRVIIEIGIGKSTPEFSDTDKSFKINIPAKVESNFGLFKQAVDSQIKLLRDYAAMGGLVALIKDQYGDLEINGAKLTPEQKQYLNQVVTQEIGSITRLCCDTTDSQRAVLQSLQLAIVAYKEPADAVIPAPKPAANPVTIKHEEVTKFSFRIDENSWIPDAGSTDIGVAKYLNTKDVIVDPAGVAFPGTGRMIDSSAGGASEAIYKKIYPDDTAYATFPYGRPCSDDDKATGKTSGKGFALNTGEAVFNNTIRGRFLVIHAIGPVYGSIAAKDEATKKAIFQDKLRDTFISVIKEWQKSGGQTLRIPLISGGIFAKGLELEEYCKIATQALEQAIVATKQNGKLIYLTPAKEIEAKFLKAIKDPKAVKPTAAEIAQHQRELEAQDDELVSTKARELGLQPAVWFFTTDNNKLAFTTADHPTKTIDLTYAEVLSYANYRKLAFPLKQPIGATAYGVVTEGFFSLLQESSMFRKRFLGTVTKNSQIITLLGSDADFLEHVAQSAMMLYGDQYHTNAEAKAIIEGIKAAIPAKSTNPTHVRVLLSIESIQNPLAFTVAPAPAAPAPKAPTPKIAQPALDCDAQTLADYLIAQQQVIYDGLFTPAAGEATLNAQQNQEIRAHTAVGFDWEVFPSSSLPNPHKSVIGKAVDEKWVNSAQIAKGKSAAYTIAKGENVYLLLSMDEAYCKNYVDCVRKYIASHGPNDKIYGTRFDKLVESLVGLTAENTRLLAGFKEEEQRAFVQEVRKFQIERNYRTDVKRTTDLSSETKDYSKQFFKKLAEMDYGNQKWAGKILKAYASGDVTTTIDSLYPKLMEAQASLPDNYDHEISGLNGDHSIIGNTKKRWLARQTDSTHLSELKAQFGKDEIQIFKKVDYSYNHKTSLKAPRKKPAVTKTDDWVKWGTENTAQMVFQVNYASGHYGGDTFSPTNGLVQEETKAYLSTTAALITANKDNISPKLKAVGGMAVREGGVLGNTKPTPVAIIGQIGDFESDKKTMPAGRPRGEDTPKWIAIAKGNVQPENIIKKRKKFVKFNELAIAADRIDEVVGKPKGNDTKESVQALFDNSLAGFQLAKQIATNNGVQCKIDTGLFGAGAFNNTAELSIAMQYLAAQIAEVDSIEFFGIDKPFQPQIDKITAAIDDMMDRGLSSEEIMGEVLKWKERKGVAERDVWRKDVPVIKAKEKLGKGDASKAEAERIAREAAAKKAQEDAEAKVLEAAKEAAIKLAELEKARIAAIMAETEVRKLAKQNGLKEMLQGTDEDRAESRDLLTKNALTRIALKSIADHTEELPGGKGTITRVQPLSISKGNILMHAMESWAEFLDGKEGEEAGNDFRKTKKPKTTIEEDQAKAIAIGGGTIGKVIGGRVDGQGRGNTKSKEEQAKERITITSDMMRFESELTNSEAVISETENPKTRIFMIVDDHKDPLPPPGLAFATLAGLRLQDADGKPRIFSGEINISHMNFNGCDVSKLDLSQVHPDIFATLKFSNCVGIETMGRPLARDENDKPFEGPRKGEFVKFKTSAISTKRLDGTFIQSEISSEEMAIKIMEQPEDWKEPKSYLATKETAEGKMNADGVMVPQSIHVKNSLEQLRVPGKAPRDPAATRLSALDLAHSGHH